MPILSCTCKNEQQDNIHGSGRRVHNKTAKDDVYRCTVCSSTRSKSGYVDPKKKGK
jgi:hypothetical protein